MQAKHKAEALTARGPSNSQEGSQSKTKHASTGQAEGTKGKSRASKLLFQSIADITSDAIFTKDQNGQYTFLNSAAAKYIGKPAPELLGKTDAEIFQQPDAEQFTDADQAIIKSGQEQTYEATLTVAGGEKVTFLVTKGPIFNKRGNIVGIYGISRDITARKQMEESLQESEWRNKIISELTTDYIVVVDVDPAGKLKLRWASDNMLRMTGRTVQDAETSDTWTRIIHPGDFTRFFDFIKNILSTTEAGEIECRAFQKQGGERWIRIFVKPQTGADNKVTSIFGAIKDITERKQAEIALHESEALYRQAIEAAGAVPYRQLFHSEGDVHVRYEFIGEGIRKITGYGPEEFTDAVWDTLVLETHLVGDLAKYSSHEASQYFRSGVNPIWKCDYKIQARDGTIRWVFEAAVNLYDERGSSYGSIGIFQDITDRKLAEHQIENQLKRLYALRTIDKAIGSSFDLRVTLEILLNQVIAQLKVDAALILLFNKKDMTLNYAASRGCRSVAPIHITLDPGESYASRVVVERKTIHIPDITTAANNPAQPLLQTGENFTTYFGTPLVAKGEIVGILEIFHRTPMFPNSDWLDYLEILAGQAAIAIDNAQMFENLKRSNFDLTQAYDATIEGWARALELRDKETEGHSRNVTELSLHLAQILGVPMEDLVHIRRGALLHDIGKMAIPDEILHKPSSLTPKEREIVMTHPDIAHGLLSPISFLEHAIEIPFYHHEKWDGSGYPQHLKGEEIPITARIFAVVDVWDALRSERPYRAAQSEEEAIQYIIDQSGKHFDPEVVAAFLRLYNQGWT